MLLILLLLFCSGMLVTYLFRVSFLFFYSAALILFVISVVSIKKEKLFNLSLALLFFVIGIVHLKNSYLQPENSIANFIFSKDQAPCAISGIVKGPSDIKEGLSTFILKTKNIYIDKKSYGVSQDTLIKLKGLKAPSCGEEVILIGDLHRSYGKAKKNVCAIMQVESDVFLIRTGRSVRLYPGKVIYSFRGGLERVFSEKFSPLAASLMKAMVLGRKDCVPPAVYVALMRSGVIHILVISGFHVGILSLVLNLFLRLARIPRVPRNILIAFCLVIYCFLVGASTPVARATIMGIFFIIGNLSGRKPNAGRSYIFAAAFILLLAPKELFSISFQLSFASVGAIIYLSPLLRRLLNIARLKNKLFKALLEAFSISVSAWLGTVFLIARYFKIVSPVALIANILIIPLAAFITIIGLIVIVSSYVTPFLTGAFVMTAEMAIILLLKLNNIFLNVPYGYFFLDNW